MFYFAFQKILFYYLYICAGGQLMEVTIIACWLTTTSMNNHFGAKFLDVFLDFHDDFHQPTIVGQTDLTIHPLHERLRRV